MLNSKGKNYSPFYMLMHLKTRVLQLNPYEGMCFFSLQRLFSRSYLDRKFIPFNYYEFGVAGGKSAKNYMKALYLFSKYNNNKLNLKNFHMFLFDSFEGMPPPKNEQEVWAKNRDQFNFSVNTVKHNLKTDKSKVNMHFIKGFFEESLTPELLETLKKNPPSLVRVDVILTSSAMTVLNFIKPILQNGTIVYFENIDAYLNNPFKGEIYALNSFNQLYREEKTVLSPIQRSFGIQLIQNHAFVYTSLGDEIQPL